MLYETFWEGNLIYNQSWKQKKIKKNILSKRETFVNIHFLKGEGVPV